MSFATTDAPIKRGKLAKRAGCHLETVRYYEQIGLLLPPERSQGGHRLYKIDDQRRLRFIMRGRELGFSIDELRSLLSLVDSKAYTCGEVHDLSVDHLTSVQQKIADLKRLEKTLSRISDECSGGAVPECPVIDALWAD
ncbi:MAG: helix-turn-helix domain-containing protein [Proteobacteria bacterium]|nr:helix-turn-helix domain-containing protein [Pseudomonadota bacterium]